MDRQPNLRGEFVDTTEYITLDDRFTTVFKRPAVIQLVCDETNNKILKTTHWDKRRWSDKDASRTTGLLECKHSMYWFYLTMIDTSRKDLHPPNSKNKMSINGHISMARWVLGMVQSKIKHLDECYRNGVTYVRHRQNVGDERGRIVVIIEPRDEVENQRGGHRILREQKYGWQQYEKQIEETIDELVRLRQALADGYCDGDSYQDSGNECVDWR
jgi:hypothetical protein